MVQVGGLQPETAARGQDGQQVEQGRGVQSAGKAGQHSGPSQVEPQFGGQEALDAQGQGRGPRRKVLEADHYTRMSSSPRMSSR